MDSIHAPIDWLTCQLSIRVNFRALAWLVRPLADENERPFGSRSFDFLATFRPMSTGRISSNRFKHGTVVLPTLSSIERDQSKRDPMENGATKSAGRARFVRIRVRFERTLHVSTQRPVSLRFNWTCTESNIEPLSTLISHPVNEGVTRHRLISQSDDCR